MTTENNEVLHKSEAEKIWDEIKNVNVEMYALPAKKISEICVSNFVEPSKCYVTGSNPTLIAVLESNLNSKFNVDRTDKYIVISRK